jgi:hypothetical protein
MIRPDVPGYIRGVAGFGWVTLYPSSNRAFSFTWNERHMYYASKPPCPCKPSPPGPLPSEFGTESKAKAENRPCFFILKVHFLKDSRDSGEIHRLGADTSRMPIG